MSYPYPQDRHRDRKEKGEHPYKDAKEALSQQEAALETEGHERGQEPPRLSSLSQGGENVPPEVLDRMREADDQPRHGNAARGSG